MKRHASLIPLSRDHHDGLVVAQGLIQGRSRAPRSNWPTDRRQQVDRVLEFFRTDLRQHFQAEEDHLFPVVAQQLQDGADLARQLRDEHDEMRARIRGLESDPATGLDERLRALGECLLSHIRKEEQVLFERMQEEMDADTLEAIGAKLRSVYASDASGPSCRT